MKEQDQAIQRLLAVAESAPRGADLKRLFCEAEGVPFELFQWGEYGEYFGINETQYGAIFGDDDHERRIGMIRSIVLTRNNFGRIAGWFAGERDRLVDKCNTLARLARDAGADVSRFTDEVKRGPDFGETR